MREMAEIRVADLVLNSFRRSAERVPAYGTFLKEAGVSPEQIKTLSDFAQLPILEKRDTFQRFRVEELCVDGDLGKLGTVLTSSGHSGIFAFGLTDADALGATVQWIDDSLDGLFQVRSKRTLLINCLPMGVKVPTQACTLAETSVRPDMTVGLVKAFAGHFEQFILVGEAAFIKHVLELGISKGVDWTKKLTQIILGEEPLAENARKYFEGLLGTDIREPGRGMIVSSMGVAELGLNLFSEAPPPGQLVLLRRLLHDDPELRRAVFGPKAWVPSLFTYDPQRIFVEFDASQRLVLTTLDPRLRVPLIRYATGDRGQVLRMPSHLRPALEAAGISWDLFEWLPVVAIEGRGDHATAGSAEVYPEAVKEGIYHDPALAALTTANFRLVSGPKVVRVRVQLSAGIAPSQEMERGFHSAIGRYVPANFEVTCERYEQFGSGMALDYERKFQYLGP
jgi:phenylacetate-CoA ligase